MAKVKMQVLDAVVDGKKKGEFVVVEERSAKMLEKNMYAKRVKEAPKKDEGKKDEGKKDEDKKDEDKKDEEK